MSTRAHLINYNNLTEEEKKKIKKQREVKAFLEVILGSIIYSIGVVWFLRLGNFFSGGVTGLSQLIVTMVETFGKSETVKQILNNNLGTFILLFNIPMLAFGWRGINKKFALLTIIAIALQTIVMNILSIFTISPFVILIKDGNEVLSAVKANSGVIGEGLIELLMNGTFNIARTEANVIMQQDFMSSMLPGTRLLLAVMGGAISGIGAALCLKGGGSTGGMDIISNYLHVKKQTSFTKIQVIVDVTIICLSSIISVENVLYTLVRLAIYMKAVDMIYTIYKTNRIEIITKNYEPIKDTLLNNFTHSMTLYQCIGGFTSENKVSMVIYASKYEVATYINIVKAIDPRAFITITKAQIMKSNYIQRTIV